MLMKRAGSAAVRAARARFPNAMRWQVICGAGNNGGDGYVVARLAAQDGIVVSVLTLVDPATLIGDAATAYGDFAAEGGVVMLWTGELDAEADLLVDAILGSGLERDVCAFSAGPRDGYRDRYQWRYRQSYGLCGCRKSDNDLCRAKSRTFPG